MSRHRPPHDGIFRAALTSLGLSVSFRSRTVSALDRFFAALVGIPATWLETVQNRIRNREYRESVVQNAAATRLSTAILEDGNVSPSVADMAVSSRVVANSGKVRLSELAGNDPLLKPTDGKLLAPDARGKGVDQDLVEPVGVFPETLCAASSRSGLALRPRRSRYRPLPSG